MRSCTAVTLAALVLCSAPARGQVASDDVTFLHEEKAFKDLGWDSGYLPSGEEIQIRFVATAQGGITVSMPTEAQLQQGTSAHDLTYSGKVDQGLFKMGLDTTFKVYLKIDKEIAGYKIKFDSELPLPGGLQNLTKSFTDQDSFTPLVLAGASERPVKVSLATPKMHLVTIDTPIQVDLTIASVKVKVPIYIKVTLKCDFQGDKVETTPKAGGAALVHTTEGQSASWPADGELTQEATAVYFGQRVLQVEVALYPEVVVSAELDLGIYKENKSWTVAEFEIAEDVVKDSKSWVFLPQPLSFTFPPPAEDGSVAGDGGGASSDGSSPTGDSGGSTGDGPAAGDGGGGGGDGDGGSGGGGMTGSGCCSVSGGEGQGPAGPLLLGLLLLGLRRRSRPDRWPSS